MARTKNTAPVAVNWKRVTNDLLATGRSQAQLGKEVMTAQSNIFRFAAGQFKHMRYETGARLLNLYSVEFPRRKVPLL